MHGTIVIDFETKKSFADVGGKHNIRQLGISVAGVYSYGKDEFTAYEEHELLQFEDILGETAHIIGFNIKQFDLPVLEPYMRDKGLLRRIVLTDIYEDATNFLGHRVGLNALAKATLREEKSGHGLEALEWFKQGRMEEVKRYCLDDVRLTRDLYEYGKKNGHLLFESFVDGKTHSIPMSWNAKTEKPIAGVVEDAFRGRRRLSIEYVSSEDGDGMGFKKSRMIDVHKIKTNGEIEAYCHLRKCVRDFRLNRILRAELTGETYTLPEDAQAALF